MCGFLRFSSRECIFTRQGCCSCCLHQWRCSSKGIPDDLQGPFQLSFHDCVISQFDCHELHATRLEDSPDVNDRIIYRACSFIWNPLARSQQPQITHNRIHYRSRMHIQFIYLYAFKLQHLLKNIHIQTNDSSCYFIHLVSQKIYLICVVFNCNPESEGNMSSNLKFLRQGRIFLLGNKYDKINPVAMFVYLANNSHTQIKKCFKSQLYLTLFIASNFKIFFADGYGTILLHTNLVQYI